MQPFFVKPGELPTADWANAVVSSVRALDAPPARRKKLTGGSSAAPVNCAFGSLSARKAIIGGPIYAGDKNLNASPFVFDWTNGTTFIYITLPVTVNTDDDGEILISGISTSSKTSITDSDWGQAASYPDNTSPTLPSGHGDIILPVGQLTINTATSAVNFVPTGCGGYSIQHCAGTLAFTRI